MLLSLATMGLALLLAVSLGTVLGRVATQWPAGRALANLLMEIRGTFLPFLVVPVVAEASGLPTWVVIGGTVGTTQAISVSRWIARRTGEWSPSLLGGIALGRSRSALVAEQATARGAVIGTLAVTVTQVVLLEALMAALNLRSVRVDGSLGHLLYSGARAELLLVLALGAGAMVATELAASWLLQRRPRRSAK